MPTRDYEYYRDMIRRICDYGTRESLESLYREIKARFGSDCEDLYRLDSMYNPRWRIL